MDWMMFVCANFYHAICWDKNLSLYLHYDNKTGYANGI